MKPPRRRYVFICKGFIRCTKKRMSLGSKQTSTSKQMTKYRSISSHCQNKPFIATVATLVSPCTPLILLALPVLNVLLTNSILFISLRSQTQTLRNNQQTGQWLSHSRVCATFTVHGGLSAQFKHCLTLG